MPDVFFSTGDKPRAVAFIRRTAAGQPQSLDDSIPDGDTVGVHLEGSTSVRFLGIDSPEKSIECDHSAWDTA
jgi:endonuclease YncB( thermonuclease family)